MKLLTGLKVKYVFSTWNLFVEWMKDGVYNFHYLPINMKVHLSKEVVETLENLPNTYKDKGPSQTLLKQLILLEEALLQNEQHIRREITRNVQVELDAAKVTELECEYHSAEYQKLLEVITALWTVSGHIKKYIDAKRVEEIAELTLPKFLLREYHQEGESKNMTEESVLKKVGFNKECSLTENQMKLLTGLKVKYVFSTWNLFVEWMKDGVYNFHYLPINMKVHLSKEVVETLENLPNTYKDKGPSQTLLKQLILLEEALLQNEQHIRREITRNVQKSIKGYMKRDLHLDMMDQLFEVIPGGVQCQNYVHLRIVINRVKTRLQDDIEKAKHKWTELVDDLWDEKHLKHLRDAATPYVELEPGYIYDPCTQQYGFEAWETTADEMPLESFDESEHQYMTEQPTQEPQEVPYTKITVKARGLTAEDVGKFLESISLPEHAKLFVKNDIDGETLLALNDKDLEELGVEKGFQRKKILAKYKTFLEN